MSRRDSQVDKFQGFDTKYSSGDSNNMELQSTQPYKEENNNEINELSKELSEMGCIVDAVKRPPNICVETCVFEDSDSDSDDVKSTHEDDAYSEEFEEDKSDGEMNTEPKSAQSNIGVPQTGLSPQDSSIKLSKSQSFMSSKAASVSGKSSNFGSVTSSRARRVNMSFSNERLREIERHNHILLNKILSARNNRKSSIPSARDLEPKKPVPAAALQRKRQQQQIDHDNMILLKKLQRAKSSSYSGRR